MVNQELLDYIEQQLKEGVSKEDIRSALVQSGWTDEDVNEAFLATGSSVTPEEPVDETAEPAFAIPATQIPTTSTLPTEGGVVSEQLSSISSPAGTDDRHTWSVIHEEEKRSGMGSLTLALILFIIVVLLVGGGAFAYFTIFKLSPSEVFTRMHSALENINSNTLTSEVLVDLDASSEEMGDGELRLVVSSDGARDIFDSENIKAEVDLGIEINASADASPIGINFIFNASIKVVEGVVYARVNKITGLPIPIDLSVIKGKWITFDSSELESYATGGGINMDARVTPVSNISDEIKKVFEENKELRDKIFVQLEGLSSTLEEITNRSATEGKDKKIGDARVYHYVIAISKEDWRTIIEKFIDVGIAVAQETNPSSVPSAQELEEIKGSEEFDTLLDIFAMIEAEMWIGKKDFLPYKSIITLEFDGFKFNDPLSVAREKARQAAIKANLSSMRVSAELFYDSNNNRYGSGMTIGSCPEYGSDSTMFAQDGNIATGISTIRGVGVDDVYCVSDGSQKYAISVIFKDGSGSWCVDNTGFSRSGVAGDNAQCGGYVQSGEAAAGKITLDGKIMLISTADDYNKPITVEIPADSVLFVDIIEELMSSDSSKF